MQLIENDALERAEQIGSVGGGEQQRELFRRRQQDFGRIAALALAFRCRRIAGSRLDADWQMHFGDRRFQIARNIDRKRLERRDVERVQSALAKSANWCARGVQPRLANQRVKISGSGEVGGLSSKVTP